MKKILMLVALASLMSGDLRAFDYNKAHRALSSKVKTLSKDYNRAKSLTGSMAIKKNLDIFNKAGEGLKTYAAFTNHVKARGRKFVGQRKIDHMNSLGTKMLALISRSYLVALEMQKYEAQAHFKRANDIYARGDFQGSEGLKKAAMEELEKLNSIYKNISNLTDKFNKQVRVVRAIRKNGFNANLMVSRQGQFYADLQRQILRLAESADDLADDIESGVAYYFPEIKFKLSPMAGPIAGVVSSGDLHIAPMPSVGPATSAPFYDSDYDSDSDSDSDSDDDDSSDSGSLSGEDFIGEF